MIFPIRCFTCNKPISDLWMKYNKMVLDFRNEIEDENTDVQDHMTAKRYLAFLFYLNDDFVGGETDFPYNELTVTPETGKVLVFPPTWQYPHRGLHVKGGSPKYIMSTYLHYQ